EPGNHRTLTARALDAADSVMADVSFNWSASAPGVATVSPAGVVTAVNVGVDTIFAKHGSVTGLAVLTVALQPVDTVVVAPAPTTVVTGGTRQLTATPRDSTGFALTGRTITWASSDSAKATVSATGLVTGVAAGSVVITASAGGKIGAANVTVDSNSVASVVLVPAGDTAMVGDTLTPVAVAKDSTGQVIPGQTATFGVSDSSVLQPITGGRFVALANGSVTLSATIKGVVHSGTVEVMTCGDTVLKSAGSFTFPTISGGLATDLSGTTDAGLFKGAPAWYGGGVMYGTDSAHMVVAYDPSLNLGSGVARHGICQVTGNPLFSRTYTKVTPLAGLQGPAGLRVVQESFHSSLTSADSAFVLFRYTFTNTTGVAITGLRTGFIVDWDLGIDPGTNRLVYDIASSTHEASESDSLAHTERLGMVAFSGIGGMSSEAWLNGADPSARSSYYAKLAAGGSVATAGPGDIRALAGLPAVTIPAYGRVVVYFAVIGGTTPAKFTTSRIVAKALADALGYN
ncbi:MAG: Ig-like domain-containing protein, partial [Gemmatimonadetes bacterium]|nr:Ig-like domain-containing protein [Gemmatimonadota bacterium]